MRKRIAIIVIVAVAIVTFGIVLLSRPSAAERRRARLCDVTLKAAYSIVNRIESAMENIGDADPCRRYIRAVSFAYGLKRAHRDFGAALEASDEWEPIDDEIEKFWDGRSQDELGRIGPWVEEVKCTPENARELTEALLRTVRERWNALAGYCRGVRSP